MGADVKIVDRGLAKFVKRQSALARRGVKVGIQSNAGKDPASGVDILDAAIFNEFGTEHAPARPAFRDFFEKNVKVIGMAMERQAGAVSDGANPATALEQLGQFVEKNQRAHVQQSKAWAVPNKPGTIERKGSDTPLIDHANFVRAIRYERI
ncbi:hypothetical protein [Cupriavidus sp. D384]|uniref:hypothetical protein n=1 Tax=Cupriavidus sp. D384 TaxID=1538095 RepID=UPI00082A8334|nr:hypothetical protein [Cupriavidus sp. D384]